MSNQIGDHPTTYFNARLYPYRGGEPVPEPRPATFQENFPFDYLEDSEKYNFSIFSLVCSLHGAIPALPVRHPANPTVDESGSRETSYQFTLRYGNESVTAPVYWQPANSSLYPGYGGTGYRDKYWYEYSYIRMGVFVNQCLSDLFEQLQTAVSPALNAIEPPFFQYDQTKAVWSLFMPVIAGDDATQVELLFNAESHNLFSGLPVSYEEDTDSFLYLAIRQPAEDLVTENGQQYLVREQLPGSLTTWTGVRKFVVTTQELDLVPETNGGGAGSTNANPTSKLKIVTDYIPPLVRGDELQTGNFIYVPPGEK